MSKKSSKFAPQIIWYLEIINKSNHMKKFSILFLMSLLAMIAVAQVTTDPEAIQLNYTGQVTIKFDPTKGDGGMKTATVCYMYSCVEVDNSGKWEYQLAAWPSKSDKTKMTKNGDHWELVIPNLYTFYGVPTSKTITRILVLFTDGTSNGKVGRGPGGQDIVITIGQKTVADIWDAVDGVAPITGTRPSGIDQGIYYGSDGTSVTLCTYAASKTQPAKRVFLLGDMTDWTLKSEYQLKRDGNYFWITLTGLTPGKEYRFQYAVERADGVRKQISDLFSTKVIHPDDKWEPKQADPTLIDYPLTGADGGYVTVIQTQKPEFQWSSATLNFQRPDKNNLVIYELWVYDYTAKRNIQGLMERLDYIQQLGVNAIELMPICEFDGNYNWGYSPNHYFAPDRAYGSETQIKEFIDECHKRGMAVIMDMVFNHATGLNPMNKLYPYGTDLSNNPWFCTQVPHDDNVYEKWNHDFAPARDMFTRALQYWIKEYKVDGYRMDLSHGLCGCGTKSTYDYEKLMNNIAHYYNNGVLAAAKQGNSFPNGEPYFILEHWGPNMGTQRPRLVEQGMLCWNNTANAYMQTTMGWLKDGDAFNDANKDGYVSYCESHDEERMQYKAKRWGAGDMTTNKATRLDRIAENVVMNVLLNGPHMLWQFEEIGYDYSINSDVDHRFVGQEKEDYRCNIKARPEAEGYFKDANRVAAYAKCAQAIQLRTKLHPEWFAGDPTAQALGSGTRVRYVQWGNNVIAVANFDPSNALSYTLPSGTWYDYYNGGSYSGSVSLQPGEVKIFTGTQVTLPTINTNLESLLPIENIQLDGEQAVKILRDGQIYILRDNKVYTLTGQLVK